MTRAVEDVAYIHTAHPQLSPTFLRGLFAALGRTFPEGPNLRICEIGSGTGLSAAITAAAYPDAQVLALDASPLHVEMAAALARDAGLANLRVAKADIATYEAGRETFDLVLCHGVLSWVSADARRAIYAFAGRHLRPHGVAYLHYASHPGAAALEILHKALRLSRTDGRSTTQNVRRGLGSITALREGAGLFAAHPRAALSFDALQREPEGFLAHELGGPHWTPLHVSDVIEAMETQACGFVGSAMPLQNIDALSLPSATLPAVRAARTRALAETLKDIARDESMRQDLFQKGGEALSPTAHLEILRGLTYAAAPRMPAKGPLTFQTRIGPVEAAASVFDPPLQRLARGPASFAELEALAPFAGRPALLNQSLALLSSAGLIDVVSSQASNTQAQDACRRLNAALRERCAEGHAIPAFACARTGGPVAAEADTLATKARP